MIEPTGEMRLAFDEAPDANADCVCAVCLNHRLAAVFAVVERDYELQQRVSAASRWRCNKTERCFRDDGHEGRHAFAGEAPS